MTLLGVVSMWTTYVSLRDSILPKPMVYIPLGHGQTWECSIFALLLSVAIGMMLFALKVAIIDEQKRLNILGLMGLIVVGFISITFNMDVLYRTADRDFYLRYSSQEVRNIYEQHLTQVQKALTDKQLELRKIVAKQEGEMEAEVKGLRDAPAGYGPIAKQEDYKLTLMVKQAQVELEKIDEALKTKDTVDQILMASAPVTLDEIQKLENDLRVPLKNMSAAAGMQLPMPVQIENPLFTVFRRLCDYHTLGLKEIFFMAIALFLDLGDILGYVLVPNKRRRGDVVVTPAGKSISPRPAIPVFRTGELPAPQQATEAAPAGRYPQPQEEEEAHGQYRRGERFTPPPQTEQA
jgi:hypothetical protein